MIAQPLGRRIEFSIMFGKLIKITVIQPERLQKHLWSCS